MKYPLYNGCIGMIQDDQDTVCKCYQDNMRTRRATMAFVSTPHPNIHRVNFVDLHYKVEHERERFVPIDDQKDVQIGP